MKRQLVKAQQIKAKIQTLIKLVGLGIKKYIVQLLDLETQLEEALKVQIKREVKMIEENEDFYYNQAQSVAEKLKDANHIPLKGSDKQIAWAEVIRAKAIDSLAIQICNKEITEEQAWQTLNNKSAGWWIDNRGNWMDVKNTTYTKTSKKTTLNAWCWD